MTACQTVSGTIAKEHASDDGDIDIELTLDSQHANLLNKGNITSLNGNLNIEAICQAAVQPDISAASPACSGAAKVVVPPVGTHVQVTGSYVLDTNHAGWRSIRSA